MTGYVAIGNDLANLEICQERAVEAASDAFVAPPLLEQFEELK
jgi:hypothetical protein